MILAIQKLPKGRLVNEGAHDPLKPILPDGIPIKVELSVDPENAIIEIDLRDNIDSVHCGLNESEACTENNVMTGVFNCLDSDIPHNSGSFRRIRLLLREGCVVGIPKFPHSCSVATTNVGERLVSITQAAFAKIGEGWGLAEGGSSMGVGYSVISGKDFRFGNRLYINQLVMGNNGGPGGPFADGWVTYGSPVLAGLMYRDSIEIAELKHPVEFKTLRLIPGTGGAGRHRGAPGTELIFGTKYNPMTVAITGDGRENPPKGVHGGHNGIRASFFRVDSNGDETELPNGVQVVIAPGEWIRGIDNSGGGYGNPLERDPQRVLRDVLECWEISERARDVYGVVLTGSVEENDLAVDFEATKQLRKELSE